jgi:hypothetical protein
MRGIGTWISDVCRPDYAASSRARKSYDGTVVLDDVTPGYLPGTQQKDIAALIDTHA